MRILSSPLYGLHAVHPAYVFKDHGLNFYGVTLRHDEIGYMQRARHPHIPAEMLFAGHRADIYPRGPTGHGASNPP